MNEEETRNLNWFLNYMNEIEKKPQKEYEMLDDFFFCPCCHFPTLTERQGYEICSLCGWEDDGQDDHNADEILGGPNSDYSLTEARENFKKHLTQYRPSDTRAFELTTTKRVVDNKEVFFDHIIIKKQMIEKYKLLMSLEDKNERKEMFDEIGRLESRL